MIKVTFILRDSAQGYDHQTLTGQNLSWEMKQL